MGGSGGSSGVGSGAVVGGVGHQMALNSKWPPRNNRPAWDKCYLVVGKTTDQSDIPSLFFLFHFSFFYSFFHLRDK